jgi:Ca2+-binding RTX toxin-like protein
MNAVTRWFSLANAGAWASTRGIVLAVSTPVLGMLALAAPASAATTTVTFNATAGAQTWTVPAGVIEATFDLYGAQGGGALPPPIFSGGLGGRATATIPVTPGASIQVNVGGQGAIFGGSGGFNGGGNPFDGRASSGGGASDIRIGGTALTDRVLVAGGGGGSGAEACGNGISVGGPGGGLTGVDGGSSGCSAGVAGGGGTQTAGGNAGTAQAGQFGLGGNGGNGASTEEGGGGGGGWYGGGGALDGGGGGGSGHGPAGTVFETGIQSGDGLVTVTYTEPSIAGLIKSVADLDLPLGTEADLLSSLTNAARFLAAGKPARACSNLAAFIVKVKAESGTNIDPADADALVVVAEAVRESEPLNCAPATLDACAGQQPTIVGTDGPDDLRGTNGDDVIAAGGGDDRVVGLRGDDRVCGGAGADLIRGRGGDDLLRGGSGRDELRGGGGSNRCRGGMGSDSEHRC